jgi:hypothetical protein
MINFDADLLLNYVIDRGDVVLPGANLSRLVARRPPVVCPPIPVFYLHTPALP